MDMIPARDDVQRSRRRLSPSKYRDHRDMLSYSVDLGRSLASVQRESSYDSFQNRTSQSGFYQRPQVAVRLKVGLDLANAAEGSIAVDKSAGAAAHERTKEYLAEVQRE